VWRVEIVLPTDVAREATGLISRAEVVAEPELSGAPRSLRVSPVLRDSARDSSRADVRLSVGFAW
jgi:hypothetical protein